MKPIKNGSLWTITMAGALALTGCGGSGSDSGTSEGTTGIFNLSVSDSPLKDVAKACIKFDGVQLKKLDGGAPTDLDFDSPKIIDLLAYQGSASEPLMSAEVEAGSYEWIRLKVDAVKGNNAGLIDTETAGDCVPEETGSYLVMKDGSTYNLHVPSGEQTGLKIVNGFTVPVNASGNYTAEWDLGRSFKAKPSFGDREAMMKPVIKLLANNEVGTLNGTVASEFFVAQEGEETALCPVESEFAPMIYVFEDDGNSENAVDSDGGEGTREPVASALVSQDMDDPDMPYAYEVGFLLAGDYEVAFTCDDQATYIPEKGKAAPIAVGGVTTVNITTDDLPAAE